jgi:predicted membrane-bound spermidine synthase
MLHIAVQRLSVTEIIEQGALRNRWLLGAIACVACRQDLVLDLIVSDECSDKGLYTFQFYKHGCWHQVVIDDHLPCDGGEVLFACSGTAGTDVWASIISSICVWSAVTTPLRHSPPSFASWGCMHGPA